MKKLFFLIGLLLNLVWANAQQDSIYIRATLADDLKELAVKQKFSYKNKLSVPITKIKLLNWIAAYKKQGTPLAKRTIENRKKDLYFSKTKDLGRLREITVNNSAYNQNLNQENLYIELPKPLNPQESLELNLDYVLELPKREITGYGTSEEQINLKYFFIVPDGFEDENQQGKFYRDIEETQLGGAFWDIQIRVPNGYYTESELSKNENHFTGTIATDPEILITKKEPVNLVANANGLTTEVVLGYPISEAEKASLEFYIPLQLNFIKDRIGFVPPKILLSEKFRDKENFFGNKDIKFWKFHFQMFTDPQKTDLDYMSLLSKKTMQLAAISEKNKNHWFENGLRTYLEIQYINQFYNDTKLLGKLPEEVKILGIKPLKYLTISQLKLTERFGMAYQYIMTQNLDQRIGEEYLALSNFNDMAISNFETGSLFDYIAQKISHKKFETFVQNYLYHHRNKIIDSKDFLDQLSVASSYSSDFLEAYFAKEMRLNFKVKKFRKIPEGYLVDVSKNTNFAIPIKITTEDENEQRSSFWFDTPQNKNRNEYLIPKNEVRKIQLNDGYIFPEANYRDNYLYTKGLFANTKKIKFKLLKDIPNPEYNEVFLSPKLNFNAYDKVLLGLNFQNKSLFDQKFLYSATPYYSTGTKTFTGSGLLAYSFRPLNTFFRSFQVGASGSYFHYNHNLAYQKFTIFTNLNFMKALRSDTNRSIMVSYNYFDKDLTPAMQANKEYGRYNLWNIGFAHSDNKLIHELYFGSNLQLMKDFQKISAETFYRWEYARNKKVSFRFFGGLFINNQTRNNLFDFGISRVSNYAFSYNLLGQSDTSGILSQQFILAEGGFKSLMDATANQWITSANTDMHLWKMFNIYADAGVYKNKGNEPKFIWDSGVKLKIIPDFLEIFLPVQSSLGFEPSFPGYSKRIRYTLVFNLNALTNHFRRGWF